MIDQPHPFVRQTVWRIVAIADTAFRLDVPLVVDTTAPAVVEAIEEAASKNGITLKRENEDDAA
jgi:hypothetical protein